MNRSSPTRRARRDVGRAGLAHADPAVLVEVLGGRACGRCARRCSAARRCGRSRGSCRGCRRGPVLSIGGIHAQPISVITNFRCGKRSNTPDEHQLHERPLRVEADLGDVRAGPRPGTCRSRARRCRRARSPARSSSSHTAHSGSYSRVVERLHPVDVGRDVAEEHAAAQAVLLDPRDVLDRVVDVVEEDLADAGACARGARRTKSTSQRLWARMPARRCSYSSGLGGRANSTKLGKNGGTVLGKTTSPTMPSAS